MYKLMIVEDEPLARAAIMKSIDFAAYDFEVVAVCEDGQEAADKYKELLPDLVITDICMPFVSGLQLAGLIAEAGHGTRVIILTGYDDFNYARTAISNQVSDYILKPVTSREFAEVLQISRKALDEQADRRNQISSAQRMLYIVSPLVRDQIMNRLVQGTVEPASIVSEAHSFGLDTAASHYIISLIHLEDVGEATRQLGVSTELLQFMITNIVAELAGEGTGFFAFSLTDGKTAILGAGDDGEILNKDLLILCRKTRDTILQTLKLSLTIGIGIKVPSLSLLKDSYSEALTCLNYRFLMPSDTIISPEDIKQQTRQFDFDKFKEDIFLQIRLQDEGKIRELIDNMIQTVKICCMSKKDIQYEYASIVNRVMTGIRAENPGETFVVDTVFPDENGAQYLTRMKEWLIQFCLACVEFLRSERHGSVRRLSVMAMEYIKEHSAESDLSLMAVCNHLSVSMSYFGIFFKEKTGKTFIEYLTEVRMDKAKELLANSDLMLYAIAEKVGYENPAYFTTAFKKNNGMNPKEYRKAFGRKG